MPESRGAAAWAVIALGGLFALIGAVLTVGGGWLLALGGSPYYLLAGLGLVASGVMLIQQRVIGVWIYVAVWVATLLWALWEVGLNGWALLPRLFAPSVLLVLALLALWPLAPKSRGRTFALGGLAAFAVVAVVGGVVIGLANRPDAVRPLPSQMAAAMSDPSRLDVGADWPAYGGTYSSRRYSPLAQITPANVDRLERAWVFETGDLPAPDADNKHGAETTPLKIGDTLYLCSATNILFALDARTG
ncbi:MAG: membrane-bound PQQ-dependent dehydrogenase, glucose/quinate/shikimate family, partial [Alphaproteobacteria bacterium]|nr:membrane-bound PQQ-dependent dehydrogenase, glucose/quinate/shikimate family [Alphaproteobacteria bacterium]